MVRIDSANPPGSVNPPGNGHNRAHGRSAVFERGFRPFFWIGAGHAGIFIPLWTSMWLGLLPPAVWITPSVWHAHEMLFGFVAAAAAGFLLTAVPNWTGVRPIQGRWLAMLVSLWLAGRLGFACASAIPNWSVALLDLPFLPALAACLAPPLFVPAQRRNRGFLAILAAWSALNAALHLVALGWLSIRPSAVLDLSMHLILVLLVVIASRVVPLFTTNTFRRWGAAHEVRSYPRIIQLCIALLMAMLAVDGLAVAGISAVGRAAALLPLLAALGTAFIWWEWRGLHSLRDALLWSLHLGFAWVPVGLLLEAASDAGLAIPRVASVHALGIGAFGGMILAMMTRVALGHTGRPLTAPRWMAAAYVAMAFAAAIRVAGALTTGWARPSLALSAVLWGFALALFVWIYTPMLFRPRIDGRPG